MSFGNHRPYWAPAQRRAPIVLLTIATGLFIALSVSCVRSRPPASTTTTRPGPTTSVPAGGATGRYAKPVFTNIQQIATAATYQPADPAAGWPKDLKLDAWAPAGDTATKRPAIVWGFPGGFLFGDRSTVANLAQDSARRGYVGITIDYRLQPFNGPDVVPLPGGGYLANRGVIPAYLDTIAAGQWLKANAARYGIDPDAIVVAGVSAGAFSALNAVMLPGGPLPPLPEGWIPPGTINPAVSPYAAAISNSGTSIGPMTNQFVSRPGEPPIIMFAGTADTLVDHDKWQVPTCMDHRARGNLCELVSYPGQGHGVFGKSAEVLDRAAAFVKEQVLLPRGYPADTRTG
jgi:acetyl esterase/lipase